MTQSAGTGGLAGPLVGVAAIVCREGRVLLGLRRGDTHGSGSWQFPGGHLEAGETVEECAERETMEETGLTVRAAGRAGFTNDIFEVPAKHYVTLFVVCDSVEGEPETLEPDKCERWQWFPWDALPAPLFLPVDHLLAQGYSLFGPANARRPAAVRHNRSVPSSTVIPVLACHSIASSGAWLERAFGFSPRLRIGDHRLQMNVGDGAIVLRQASGDEAVPSGHSIMVRVADAFAHHARAAAAGATIRSAPTDHPYGERQYSAIDCDGRVWTFTESLADVDPESWGGQLA